MLRRSEPQLHHRDQAHASRKRFGATGDQGEGFAQARRRCVVERVRNHAPASATIFQIFSGVSGISTWRTPSGESASITEFTMAGVEPIVPASPTPFTPSGFTGDGVQVCELSIQGIDRAR